ncbi:4-carboxymuconolactone decarboxylase [Actinoplanes sp. CA-030573]|uniref:bifunctional 3-oxoadipate enol-lactonase/4-carboxymuconolactone decarboxylase PcaDC n=1 Tax=Actinoplanes sp. CA-030573 TaxID=3239898 RepID=UPI003D91268A
MLTAVTLVEAPGRPLLLLGPSLGTSAEALWGRCARLLTGGYHVVGWELPGHGRGAPATAAFGIAGLAEAVLELADRIRPGETFRYAGDSVGGAVGLQLLLDAPGRVESAVLIATGAKIGEAGGWRQRAATVRAEGTQAVVAGSLQRWFSPGFPEKEPEVVRELIDALRAADPESYALVCEALATFDVRDRLGAIEAPVLAVAGVDDGPTPPEDLALIAGNIRHGQLVMLDGAAHLPPAELPATVASLMDDHFGAVSTEDGASGGEGAGGGGAPDGVGSGSSGGGERARSGQRWRRMEDVRAAGMAVRRAVLGDAHVDRATAGTTPFTADFQELITAYAWGEIWTRPGLDRRSRSMITLTALVALGHHEELAMHVRAARTNGLSVDEIKEVLLQSAIYCGVPAANTAFRIAQRVLEELDD